MKCDLGDPTKATLLITQHNSLFNIDLNNPKLECILEHVHTLHLCIFYICIFDNFEKSTDCGLSYEGCALNHGIRKFRKPQKSYN